jgi:hypothetical protein
MHHNKVRRYMENVAGGGVAKLVAQIREKPAQGLAQPEPLSVAKHCCLTAAEIGPLVAVVPVVSTDQAH